MDQIISQIIGPVVNILTGHITKHIQHITSSTKRVADMISNMEVLKGKSIAVNEHKERNNRNNKEIPARVEGWLRDVEDVNDQVQSISTDVNIGCLHVKKRYRAGRNALKTIEKIERLINEEEKISWSDVNIPLGRVDSKPSTSTLAPSPSCETNDFKSRDKAFEDALKYLQQDDKTSQVIALCGMGGVGKTTMMEQLKKVAEGKQMFKWIAKSVVGQNPNMISVQNDIAAYLKDCDLPNGSKLVRAEHLTKTIAKLSEDNKKVLIILDDVWKKIELKDIGLTSPLPKGVKLLLTSRYYDICKQITVDANSDLQVVKVDVLEEAEAHKFFSGITGVLEEDDPDKYHIGCGIVKKSGYLPLAIKHIASTLKSEEISIWRDTLKKRLKNNRLDENVQEIIKISYERIEKDEECKAIFLHCGLFPEDANISIEDLTRHAWGLKLLNDVSTLREARDRTKTCVQKLINANLLINSDHVGCVKMHDLVLVFVLGEFFEKKYPYIINHGDVSKWAEDEIGESCKRISLTCRGLSEFPREFKYPNLSLLQLMHGDESLKFSENFYENMEHLQVIAYYEMSYPLLPRSLKCTTNLKALCLHSCKLMFNECSFIGDLVNLEVLSFAHCAIRKLPATIANLRNLKLLDLTGCVDLHIDDGVFNNLECLEELYMRVSKGKGVRFTNASFEELKMLSSQLHALEVEFVEKNTWPENFSFKKLDKFKISIGCLLEEEEEYGEKTLKLVTECSSQLQACKINEMFRKTEHLHLQVNDMIGLEDISIRPYGQRSFCSLIELEISNCVNLIYLFPMSVASGLKKLERLRVLSCSVLKALVQDDGREINSAGDEMIKFEKLKFFSLRDLPKLEILFSIENVVDLPQLVELEVAGLPNFTSIYPDKKNSCALLNSQVRISKLEVLGIQSMENLKQIWGVSSEEDDNNNNNISTLRKIRVERCNSLVNMFPSNPMRLMDHLESLFVYSCGSIEVIFNIDLECVGQVELLTNSSLRSIDVDGSEKVREVWRIKGGENNYSSKLTCRFEALERIDIFYCKRFRNIFTPTNTNCKIHMPALTDMRILYPDIRNCQEEEDLSREERDDSISTVAFPTNLIRSFHFLQKLVIDGYDGVDGVFEMESSPAGGRQLVTITNNQQPLLPNLQNLILEEMNSISHVWKCSNWNTILILQKQSSFQNLTTIYIFSCNRIKYLFSPLMAKLLLNLKKIDILMCEGMEEVVSNRDDTDEAVTTTYTTTTFFPHLHSLSLKTLRTLKRIGGGVGAKSSTGITTHDHFESSHATTIVPWSLCQYSRKILIDECDSLMEVFETLWVNNNSAGGITSTSIDEGQIDTRNTSLVIQRPENIKYVPRLDNLKKLVIKSCNLLKHAFTFSTLGSLKQLEELMIKKCNAMEVIVRKENEEQRNVVDFPRLKSLVLKKLPNLKGFFLGMNEFKWPLLEKVMIDYCPKVMVFTSGQSTALKINYMHTSLGKHSLECGLNFHVTKLHQWSFHNLIELHMEWEGDVKYVIPSNELLHLKKLVRIKVNDCRNLEEVFEAEEGLGLELLFREEEVIAMKGINSGLLKSQSVVELPNLMHVELQNLDRLKYISRSNHHGILLKFSNLTTLSIDNCYRLEHVFTSSMVGSLQQLQDLHISDCPNMEVIIKVEEEEFEYDVTVKDAMEEGLGLELLFREEEEEEEEVMKGINSGLVKSQTVVEIPNLMHVELHYLESLKYISRSNHRGILLKFSNLPTLSIYRCKSLEHVFSSSMVGSLQQLQDLHISGCPNMEVIVKVEEEKEDIECDAEVKEIVLPRLKSLKLNKLKSLKGFCFGKVDFSWPSLHTLEITGCPEITVFSKGLVATPNLNIIDTSFGRCNLTEDINSFIKTKQDEGFSLGEYMFYSSEDESE